MPIIRGPKDKADPSEKTEKNPKADAATRQVGGGRPAGGAGSAYEEKTVVVGRGEPTVAATPTTLPATDDDEKTMVVGGAKRKAGTATSAAASADPMADPVVGWLVVVDGPGKGASRQLGYGQNSIGRGADQRVRLDYGDGQISSKGHAMVTYDPKGRKFYVQNGSGVNLTYLNNEPVLAPAELTPGTDITLGETTLRLVAFCGKDFDWQDSQGAEPK